MTKVRVRDVIVVGSSFAILLVILLPSLLLTNRLSVNMIIIYDVDGKDLSSSNDATFIDFPFLIFFSGQAI